MTKDGLVEHNETTGDEVSISKRNEVLDLQNAASGNNAKDIGVNDARRARHSYSKSKDGHGRNENHSTGGSTGSTRKRNKAAYRKHNQLQQKTGNSSLSPKTHGAIEAAATTQQLQLPPPIVLDTPKSRASPSEITHNQTTQGQQDSDSRLKTQRSTPYNHNKQSVLQDTIATSALQNKPPPESAIKHHEDKLNIADDVTGSEAQSTARRGKRGSSRAYSQVGNKPKDSQNEQQKGFDNGDGNGENNAASSQNEQRAAEPTAADSNSDDSSAQGNSQSQSASQGCSQSADPEESADDSNESIDTPRKNTQSETNINLPDDKDSKLKFNDNLAPNMPKSRKLLKAEKGVKNANSKLENAKDNLPTKKKLRNRLVFDEEKGKSKREFYIEKKTKTQAEHLKTPLPLRPVKSGANSALNFAHNKIFQVEHENVEVKAAHRGEMAAEGGVRGVLRHHRARKYRRVVKLERAIMKKNTNLAYRKALERNPKLKSNMLSRMWQKRKIRKQYARAAREAKRTVGFVKIADSLMLKTTKAAAAVLLNPKVLAVLLIAGLIVALIMSIVSLAMSFGSSGMGGILSAVYLSEDEDIDTASVAFTDWETDLRLEIINAQANNPGFDEYIFDIGNIGHDPLALMAFLTATFHDFTFDEIAGELRALFDELYNLSFTPSMEMRTRTETRQGSGTDPATGEPFTYTYQVVVQYEWHILTVTLESRPFHDVIMERMTPEQTAHFNILMHTQGARHHVGSPFAFNWLPFISSHYGWRLNPFTNARQLHLGIDIALPTGTEIVAAHAGEVTFAGNSGGYGLLVIIDDGNGIVTKYAHADTLLVSQGQEVAMGDPIATVGSTGDSTGPHLHFEVLINGVHRNPIFFAFGGD